MSWFYLLLAMTSEVAGTIRLRLSAGFSRPLPSIMMFALYGNSLAFTNLAAKKIDLGIGYTIGQGLEPLTLLFLDISGLKNKCEHSNCP